MTVTNNGLSVLFRCDGDRTIGFGHVMRCLALAQEWHHRGMNVCFLSASLHEFLRECLRASGIPWETVPVTPGSQDDRRRTAAVMDRTGSSCVVVDGYEFGVSYQRALHDRFFVVMLDDVAGKRYSADILVNPNLYADEELYDGRLDGNPRRLLGSRYVLLRDGFLDEETDPLSFRDGKNRFLLVPGGSKQEDVVMSWLEGVERFGPGKARFHVVVPDADGTCDSLRSRCRHLGVQLHGSQASPPGLYRTMDGVFCGAGSTAWELCFLGVPQVSMILADNQVPIARCLEDQGAGISLGRPREWDPDDVAGVLEDVLMDPVVRDRMSRAGQKLVDGQGRRRVADAVEEGLLEP